MGRRLIVIPRWSGWPESDWYPWLVRTLQAEPESLFDKIVIGNMPQPNLPIVRDWVDETLRLMGDDEWNLAKTVMIGHSVGCQAILRSLAQLAPGLALRGSIFVAGWFDVDNPWPAIKPWVRPIDGLERAKAAAGQVATMLSDNDPFSSDWQDNRRQWKENMGASVTMIPGAQHFNGSTYPMIIEMLNRLI